MAKFQGSRFSSGLYKGKPKEKYHPKSTKAEIPSPGFKIPKAQFIVITQDEVEYPIYETQQCSLEDVKGFARCLTRFNFKIINGNRKEVLYKGK